MSNFLAGNLIRKLSFNIQPRLIPLPWMKRSAVKCFSSKKADGSELPVRYIPKKLRDVNGMQCSSSGDRAPKVGVYSRSSSSKGKLGRKTLDRINHPRGSRIDHEELSETFDGANGVNETIKHGKRAVENKCFIAPQEVFECMNVPEEDFQELKNFKRDSRGQVCELNQENNYCDGVADSEYMEVLVKDVEEMQPYNGISKDKQKESKTCRTNQGAEKVAIELLAKRALTGVEFRKKLTAKNFPVDVVEAVLLDFQDRGLINDHRYAEMFSLSKWKSLSWGPRRIKQALMKKGISEGDVEKAVKLVFEDEDSDKRSSTRLSKSSLQQLYVQASKQWIRCRDVPHDTRKARVIRWLQYRGFDWGVVGTILKKLESEIPP